MWHGRPKVHEQLHELHEACIGCCWTCCNLMLLTTISIVRCRPRALMRLVHHLMWGKMKIPLETTLMKQSPRQMFSMQSALCKTSWLHNLWHISGESAVIVLHCPAILVMHLDVWTCHLQSSIMSEILFVIICYSGQCNDTSYVSCWSVSRYIMCKLLTCCILLS